MAPGSAFSGAGHDCYSVTIQDPVAPRFWTVSSVKSIHCSREFQEPAIFGWIQENVTNLTRTGLRSFSKNRISWGRFERFPFELQSICTCPRTIRLFCYIEAKNSRRRHEKGAECAVQSVDLVRNCNFPMAVFTERITSKTCPVLELSGFKRLELQQTVRTAEQTSFVRNIA